MENIPEINLRDYDYSLPPEQIAQFPLENRDASKLLIYSEQTIREDFFSHLGKYIPRHSLLVFNDTKVVPARLIFSKKTGATIEVFCLEPLTPASGVGDALKVTDGCTWRCLVGNVKRWKGELLTKEFTRGGQRYSLSAWKKEDLGDGCFAIEFHWTPPGTRFLELLEYAGLVPLPPYITRAADDSDAERYQTIYAMHEGSVAAPTAGLHFTETVLNSLRQKQCAFENITLHVGLGTFRPVNSPGISAHIMHGERIFVSIDTIHSILENHGKSLIAVGTTSVRAMETLYWAGVRLQVDGNAVHPEVRQWDPYDDHYAKGIAVSEASSSLVEYIVINKMKGYSGTTHLLILPGYRFRFADAMVTNFHMPQSTLLMLVGAFIGKDWRKTYEFALQYNFRFLSYGDACLFFNPFKTFAD